MVVVLVAAAMGWAGFKHLATGDLADQKIDAGMTALSAALRARWKAFDLFSSSGFPQGSKDARLKYRDSQTWVVLFAIGSACDSLKLAAYACFAGR